MAAAFLALLAGLWAGLIRLGWLLPVFQPRLVSLHGPLMVSGFLGTLIGVERAVGLGLRWCYLGPLLTAAGTLGLLLGLPGPAGPLLIVLGSAVLVLDFVVILRRHVTLFAATMMLGAAAWGVGNILWISGRLVPHIVPWYMGFLVLTIAGERLELSRLLRLGRTAQAVFLAGVGVLLAGLCLEVEDFVPGVRLAGAGTAVLAAWLLRGDIALKTVRAEGLPRFIALCLLPGYVWLGIGGVLAAVAGGALSGPSYDAALHAVFLGFVFSMIFGHAPIIIPAVLGSPVPFRGSFYSHLVLLHASLVLRVTGDLADVPSWVRWGGTANVASLLLFFGLTALSVARRPRPAPIG